MASSQLARFSSGSNASPDASPDSDVGPAIAHLEPEQPLSFSISVLWRFFCVNDGSCCFACDILLVLNAFYSQRHAPYNA